MLKTKILFTKQIDESEIVLDPQRFEYSTHNFIKINKLSPLKIRPQIDFKISHHIFTSVHACFVIDAFNLSGFFYVVGTKTMADIEVKGRQVEICAGSAGDLAKTLITIGVKDFQYFSGNRSLEEIPNVLMENKINCNIVRCYENSLESVKIDNAYDAYVFFSPSGVESFFNCNQIPTKADIFALGQTTQKALNRKGYKQVVTSRDATFLSMQEKIKEYYA